MMEQWTLFPTILQRKFLLTLLAGIASAGISAIICVATKDHILLALGIVVLCACLISCRGIWATATHKNYEVVEGICAGISTPMLRHYRKVHLMPCGKTSVKPLPPIPTFWYSTVCGSNTNTLMRLYPISIQL